MTAAFTIPLEATIGGRQVKGAGSVRIGEVVADINGQRLDLRRISLDLLVADIPQTEREKILPPCTGSR